jgi:hypothetical protein
MATSGSKSITVTSYDTLRFSWSESSQSIANNTTTVSWKLELIAGSSGRIDSSAPKSWSVTVNGTKYSGTNYIAIANNATITLASGTTTIAHNTDGTKTFSYSFSQQFSITFSGASIGTKSGSGTGTLDTIARKSSLSASNGTLGTALNLTVSRQSTSFTHTITYKCGSASGTVCTKSSSTSVAWNTSNGNTLSLASQNTTGTTVSVTFTITTYNGDTPVGSNTKTVTMTIPASVKPSCTVTVTDTTGYKSTYGQALKGLSKLKIVVNPTIAQGSAIASYKVTVNGATYTTATSTTDVLKYSGNVTITATVTDKRGRSGSVTVTENVYDYSPPQITKLSVNRCDASGNEKTDGSFIKVTYSGEVDSINNKNSASFTLYKKRSSETSYGAVPLSTGTYKITDGTIIIAADTESSHDIRLTVADALLSTSTTTSASTAYVLLDFGADGTSIGVGKVAEISNLLDLGFRLRTYAGVLQPVLEAGTDFNNVLIPNTYTLKNANTANYGNCPIATGTGVLKVESCGEAGQVRQVVTVCHKTSPLEYERFYYQGEWGAWKRNFEVELYNSTSGAAGSVTLSESAANFRYIEIFFTDNNGKAGGCTKVYSPNGKTVCLSIIEAGSSVQTYFRRTGYTINGTSIAPITDSMGYVRIATATASHTSGTNYIRIVRVVGYE